MRFLSLSACALAVVSGLALESPEVQYFSKIKHAIQGFTGDVVNKNSKGLNRSGMGLQNAPFPCTDLSPSPSVPTSVHQLRPGDIKVIAAVGDSITAGFGESSNSVLDLILEFRGRSWSIGVEKDISELVTMAGILKQFNPSLIGGSTGTGGANSANAVFNVAISGAIAKGMPGQTKTLIERMKADSKVDFEKDWKVVTLWIGGNDLCAVCKGGEDNKPQRYVDYIEEALDILQAQMPRTFVNLVVILDVTQLYDLDTLGCKAFHGVVCGCGTDSNADTREFVRQQSFEYMRLTEELAKKDKWNSKDDFTVVSQPFFTKTTIPLDAGGKPDRSFFAPDCFHFSEKGHEAAGIALWNNMLEPVGAKRDKWTVGEAIECPTAARPYLATAKNSVNDQA